MKRISVISLVVVFVVGIFFVWMTISKANAQASQINLSVDQKTVRTGEALDLNVQITAPADEAIIGWQFDLAFDPQLLNLNSVEVGNSLNQCALIKDTFFYAGKIDNLTGTLTGVAEAGLGIPLGKGCSGSEMVMARLHFTVLGNGAPIYTLSNVILVDTSNQAYHVSQYSLTGALRQTVDPEKLSTQQAEDAVQAVINQKLHRILSPTESAQATQMAYFSAHPFPTIPPSTPVYFAFQSTDDIIQLVSKKFDSWKDNPFYESHIPTCIKTGLIGTPIFVKSLVDSMPNYYLMSYSVDGHICGYATFNVYQDGEGDLGTFGGGLAHSEPIRGVSRDIFPYLQLTVEDAISLVKKAGFEIKGEPRLVYQDCAYACTQLNPPWEVMTTNGEVLYIIYDYYDDMNAPVILTKNEVITQNGIIKP